jgi:type IV pilus assembly protein PilW
MKKSTGNLRNACGSAGPGRQSGFGLVELMVSVAIGLVILAALVALFMGASRNNREMATANSVIENGRFAIQLLESDVVHGGFWGTFVPRFDDQTVDEAPDPVAILPTGVPDGSGTPPDPCLPYDPATWDAVYRKNVIGIPVQTYTAARFVADTSCDAVLDDLGELVDNTDVLVVRHADTCTAGEGSCDNADGKLYFQSALCEDEVPGFVLGVKGADAFPLTRRDCAAPADRRKFVSNIYYVRRYAVDKDEDPRIPTLVRSEFELDAGGNLVHLQSVPLIEGIQAMRVELGIDSLSETGGVVRYDEDINWTNEDTKTEATNRGDGVPDGEFVRCDPCDTDQLINVAAVKIHVLARSRDETRGYTDNKRYAVGPGLGLGPYADGFKRHVYSTTVRLPNVAGRRTRPGDEPEVPPEEEEVVVPPDGEPIEPEPVPLPGP